MDREALELTVTLPEEASDRPSKVTTLTLGRYRLEHPLGQGGMGVVHAAFDPDLERRVAIKLLHDAEDGDAPSTASRARLLREARAMARLTHPNVVNVYEVGSIGGRDFVAMELIDGSSLAEWLRTVQRDPDAILDAFADAGRGLAAAHAAGLVHRDFKPHNVLRSHAGRICVTDFGLARGMDSKEITSGPVAAIHGRATTSKPIELTETGVLVGTPAYMAPEQWSGAAFGPATDQFGFCVALWEALTGERPFQGTSSEDLRAEVEKGPAALDASKLPPKLRPILRRGLDPKPDDRFPSMDALLAAIANARRRRGPGRMYLAIGLAVVIVALVAGVAWRSSTPPVPARTPAPEKQPPSRGELLDSIKMVGNNRYEVPRATVNQLLEDRVIAEDARLIPTFKDDVAIGYKIYAIRPRSVFHAVKLTDGDTLTSIGGVPLTSPESRAAVLAVVRSSQELIVELIRRNESVKITIAIVP